MFFTVNVKNEQRTFTSDELEEMYEFICTSLGCDELNDVSEDIHQAAESATTWCELEMGTLYENTSYDIVIEADMEDESF